MDKDGEVLGYDDYYPFGLQMAGRSSNTANPNHLYKFSGKELDEEIGLDWYYFGARYYDPVIGRWMAVDPKHYLYPSLSPYVYCANNPIRLVDPNGMELRGDSTELAEIAEEGNKVIKDKGVDDATLTVKSGQREKTGLKYLIAKIANALGGNVSTTEKVFFLATEGSGWDKLRFGEISSGNEIVDTGLNWLNDMIESPTPFYYESVGDNALGALHGNVVTMGSKEFIESEKQNKPYTFFAIFMEEFVGHGHPLSPNAVNAGKQGGNIIGNSFGYSGWHNHLATEGKPGGGYLGYPVTLIPFNKK